MNVLGLESLDAEGRARLAAAMARVQALQARMGFGSGVILASASDRVRAFRQRQRDDVVLLRIEMDRFELIDGLISKGDVTEAASRNKKLLSQAVVVALRKHFKKQ